jgi:hypothetical protein
MIDRGDSMINRRTFIVTGLAGITSLPAQAQSGGWVTLFDGRTLDGWTQVGDPNVTLGDGVVQADKGNGHLVWKNAYTDFELRAEIWVDANANSGVFIRFPDKTKPSSKDGYEFNIYDARPDPSYGTGAIVATAKAGKILKAGGKWTLMEITAKGAELTFKLDGTATVDKAPNNGDGHAASDRGFISLQFGGGLVRFRKIEIKEL